MMQAAADLCATNGALFCLFWQNLGSLLLGRSNAAALSWHANVVAWHKPPSEVTLNKTATALCESAGEMQGACFKDMCAIGGDATDQIATNYQTALATSVLFESIVSGLL